MDHVCILSATLYKADSECWEKTQRLNHCWCSTVISSPVMGLEWSDQRNRGRKPNNTSTAKGCWAVPGRRCALPWERGTPLGRPWHEGGGAATTGRAENLCSIQHFPTCLLHWDELPAHFPKLASEIPFICPSWGIQCFSGAAAMQSTQVLCAVFYSCRFCCLLGNI